MDSIVLYSRGVFSLPSRFSFTKQLKLGKPLFSLKDGPLACGSAKDDMVHSSVSETNSDRRDRAPSGKEAGSGRFQFSEGRKEEILSLLRRIRSSISKDETKSNQNRKANLSRGSNNQLKDAIVKKEEKKIIRRKKPVPKKDQKLINDGQTSALDFNASRPPSNFSKRSPIPSLTAPRGNPIEVSSETSMISGNKELKDMKLPELKELAKTRGIKGYSKLKKSELLELLSS